MLAVLLITNLGCTCDKCGPRAQSFDATVMNEIVRQAVDGPFVGEIQDTSPHQSGYVPCALSAAEARLTLDLDTGPDCEVSCEATVSAKWAVVGALQLAADTLDLVGSLTVAFDTDHSSPFVESIDVDTTDAEYWMDVLVGDGVDSAIVRGVQWTHRYEDFSLEMCEASLVDAF